MRLVTGAGLQLPDLGFGAPRSGSATPSQPTETSYFAQCKIHLSSPDPRVGDRRDPKGSIVITPDPSVIKFTVNRLTVKFMLSDPKFQIRRRSGHSLAIRDSSKATVTLTFRLSVAYLSFLATIFLHKKTEAEGFVDAFKGEGHAINDRDGYDVYLTSWKYKSPTALADLIEDKAEFSELSLPPPLRPSIIGFQTGGLRFLWLKKKVVAMQLKSLREYRARARIPVVYGRFLELQQLCDQLIEVSETAIRRQRVQRTVSTLKARLDTLTAAVDTNTLLIERLHEDKSAFTRKMSEVERAKRRIDVDESDKQTKLLKQQVAFRAALNEIVMKSDDLSLGLMRFPGERATLGSCISAAFTVVCCAIAEGEGDQVPVSERLENARRMIAESVFL
jgi:hypothetical protein